MATSTTTVTIEADSVPVDKTDPSIVNFVGPEAESLHVPETLHRTEVPGGHVDGHIGIAHLRAAIPAHCFTPSTTISLLWFLHDLTLIGTSFLLAVWASRHPAIAGTWVSPLIRFVVYPFVCGLPATGMWVLAHEAGHGSFSRHRWVADAVGFFGHSVLLSPYFAWRSTHARHHVYANHMRKDHNYVPPVRAEYRELFRGAVNLDKLEEMTEDAPAVVLLRVVFQQVVGWPWYLLSNITAGPEATVRPSRGPWDNSHFDPGSALFRPDEFWAIVASDAGIVAVLGLARAAAAAWGWNNVLWAWALPVAWVNHWIVMITYLHHTAPDLPKYAPAAWTFVRGALATVDRDPGPVLRYLTHHIIDLHVVHHLFPRIPHYRAAEATAAIRPLLGKHYHQDKGSYFGALYRNFTDCQWVEPGVPSKAAGEAVPKGRQENKGQVDDGVLWYRSGRMPAPVLAMKIKGE